MNPSMMKDMGAFLNPQGGNPPALAATGVRNSSATFLIDRELPGTAPGMALSCDLVVIVGAVAGAPTSFTVNAKIQDSADGVTFADYLPPGQASAASIAAITAANQIARKRVDLSGARRYIQVVETVAFVGGASPTVAVAEIVELAGLQNPPTA